MTTNHTNPRADSDGQPLSMADASLDSRLGDVETMLGQIGADERSRLTPAMFDRIARATWQAEMPNVIPALQFDGRPVEAAKVARARAHTIGSGRALRMAAAIAIFGTIAAGIVAMRSSPSTSRQDGNEVASKGGLQGASGYQDNDSVVAVTTTDPDLALDLALIDALWKDDSLSTDDLWADAGMLDTSSDVTIDQLLGGGATDTAQGGAM